MALMLVMVLVLPLAAALPPSHLELVPGDHAADGEPSCATLRKMWQFSKRQSRAAQITNEIPTYRDPFAYPLFESQIGGRDAKGQSGAPVYGMFRNGNRRPLHAWHNAPRLQNSPASGIITHENSRRLWYGNGDWRSRAGGPLGPMGGLPTARGSLQRIRELVQQERLRDVQEQRLAEEAVASRHYKDAANPHFGRVLNEPSGPASSLDLALAAGKRAGAAGAAGRAEQVEQAAAVAEEEQEAEEEVEEEEASALGGGSSGSQYVM